MVNCKSSIVFVKVSQRKKGGQGISYFSSPIQVIFYFRLKLLLIFEMILVEP